MFLVSVWHMLRITESSFVEDNSIVSKVPCVPGGFCWALSIEQINTELNVNAVNMVIRYSPVCSFRIHNRMPSKICLRTSQVANQAGTYLWFWNTKWLGVFLPPHSSITGLPPALKLASTHLYTWVERGTVRVKCKHYGSNPNRSPWGLRTSLS